jgi:nucleoside-diphosphate-sugar epimerase
VNSLTGKAVLLTGATGFIGSHLANRLKQIPEVKVILLTRKAVPESEGNLIWVTSAQDQLTRQTWSDHGIEAIDAVFHLGAFIPRNSNEVDAVDKVYRDNLLGTRALLDSLPNTPEKIVFSSTVDVYASSQEDCVLTEKSPLEPPSLYGASKLFCEHLIKAYARKHACGYAILRYGHIYGPGEGAYAKFIPQVIKTLLCNESPVVYGDGSVLRDFMFVGDAVEATIRAAISSREKIEPVNIVSGESKPIREFVEILSGIAGFPGGIKYLLDKPGGRSLQFSNARMLEVLGEWDLFPLEEGLRQEVNYFKDLQ